MRIEFAYEKSYTDDVELIKDIASIAQSLTTMLAIIVSGFWGYWIFVKNRQQYPRARLSHSVLHRELEGGKMFVHVILTIQNIGEILLSLRLVETRVHQVIPLPKKVAESIKKGDDPVLPETTEIDAWTVLGTHRSNFQKNLFEVEPGEVQEIHHDFVVSSHIRTVLIYSYLQNIKKRNRDIGWDLTTFHDLN